MELEFDIVGKICEYSLLEFNCGNIWVGVKVSLNGLTVPLQNHNATNGEEAVGKVKDLRHRVESVELSRDQIRDDMLHEEREVHDREDRDHCKCLIKEERIILDREVEIVTLQKQSIDLFHFS